ncbi:hypothetical protein FO519_007228 [Halicephalobus sp. NKZ332]|nr:hypothetical protein FO519_007228 [Halicephalobus sp. NKZ332]
MLLTLSPDRPVQAALAMYRSARLAMATTVTSIICIILIATHATVSTPIGFVILGISVVASLIAAVIGLFTFSIMKREIGSDWDDRPVQAAIAMFRSARLALVTTITSIICIVVIASHASVSTPIGFALLGISVAASLIAAVIGFLTASIMRKDIGPNWDSSIGCCACCIPY